MIVSHWGGHEASASEAEKSQYGTHDMEDPWRALIFSLCQKPKEVGSAICGSTQQQQDSKSEDKQAKSDIFPLPSESATHIQGMSSHFK